MNFNKLLVVLMLLFSFQIKGQEAETISSSLDSLIFQLKIAPVLDIETKEVLTNVKIIIIGTDGTRMEFISDSVGIFPEIYLSRNTSYSTFLEKEKYLNCKGKETTVGSLKSKFFYHEYEMKKMTACVMYMPQIFYNKNQVSPFFSSIPYTREVIPDYDIKGLYLFYSSILTDNPYIIVEIKGYREESERGNKSLKRAEQLVAKLIALGIDEKRFVVVDGGVSNLSQQEIGRRELSIDDLKQENRKVTFKILSTDFDPK